MATTAHYIPARIPRRNLLQDLSATLTVVTVLTALLVSNLALSAVGIQYDIEGGIPLEKIHPATYVATFAILALLLAPGNPFVAIDDIVRRHNGLILFLLSWLFLLVHILIVLKGPFTNIVDTFLLPPLLLILLVRLDEAALSRLAKCMHVIFAANAVLGIVELASGWRLTPLIVSGAALSSDWRPSAILGHPLANAAAIGCYIVAMLLGGGRDLPTPLRIAALLLQMLALVVFGGRAAAVLVIPFASALLIAKLFRATRDRRLSALAAAGVAIALPILPIAIAIAYNAGVFDQFVTRFLDDDGSAKTRYEMFAMLAELPLPDLIFGPDPELIATLKFQFGLEFGIESFWVSLIAHYGLMSTAFFLVGLACLCISLARGARPESAWVVLYFILVASASESIAAKTMSFAVMTSVALVLLRHRPHGAGKVR